MRFLQAIASYKYYGYPYEYVSVKKWVFSFLIYKCPPKLLLPTTWQDHPLTNNKKMDTSSSTSAAACLCTPSSTIFSSSLQHLLDRGHSATIAQIVTVRVKLPQYDALHPKHLEGPCGSHSGNVLQTIKYQNICTGIKTSTSWTYTN